MEVNAIQTEKTLNRSMKLRAGSLKSWTKPRKKKGLKIRNERGGDITPQTTEIQRVREPKQLYTNKLDKLEEMAKFLEAYNLPILSHQEIKNLNRLITSKNIESEIKKNFPTEKAQDQMASLVKCLVEFKKN